MDQLLEKPATASKSTKNYQNFLKSVPLFNGFPDQAIAKVLSHVHVKEFEKSSILFMAGDNAEYFHVIVNGWIKLYRQTRDGHEAVFSVLTNGDVFGRAAVLGHASYIYTAEAITDGSMLLIPNSLMVYMMDHHTEFDHFLPRFLEAELNDLNQLSLHAEHLAQMTSAQRVGCFLLRMCGETREGSIMLQLPYEKTLAAGRLGMTAETFSRSLNQLVSIGVETKNSTITIHNIEQLQTHVCERCSATQRDCSLGKGD